MAKSADAFRTISEVAEWLGLQTHVLRFWESKFSQVKPIKRAGGRRYYRPNDMLLLGGIKRMLHDDGMTIKGVQKALREEGVKYVASLSQPLDSEETELIEALVTEEEKQEQAPSGASAGAEDTPEITAKEPVDLHEPKQEEAPSPSVTAEDQPEASDADQPVSTETKAPHSEAPELSSADDSAPSDTEEQTHSEPEKSPASPLPTFLQRREDQTESAPEAEPTQAPLISDAPAFDPSDEDPDVSAGLLSRLATTKLPLSAEADSALRQARRALQERLGQ